MQASPAGLAGKEHIQRFQGLESVELYSGVSDEELLHLYQTSDIGLMPLEDSTANNGLLEMMACGLPSIATRVGSVADYLTEDAGILLKNNDPALLLEALNTLVESPIERSGKGMAARKRAVELSWENIANELAEIYRDI